MLGFLFKMDSAAVWTEIDDARIMGSGTITPCLERLWEDKLVKFTETMYNKHFIKFWEITEEGEKRFLESISTDGSAYLILRHLYQNEKAQEKDIRKALLLEIDERVIYFTIDKLCKQKLLYKTSDTEEYALTPKGIDAYKEAHKEVYKLSLTAQGYKDTLKEAF